MHKISEAQTLESMKNTLRRYYLQRDDVKFDAGLDAVAAEMRRLRSVFVAAQVFADSFAKFPNAALPGSPARQLFDAVKAAVDQ